MKKNVSESIIRRYVTWVTRHPYIVIASVFIMTIFLITQMGNLKVELDPDRLLPKEHPMVKLGDEISETFKSKHVVVINLEVKEGTVYNQQTLEKVQRITEKVKTLPGIIENNVLSIAASNVKDIKGTEEGMEISQLMETIPTSETEMNQLKKRVNSSAAFRGVLVSSNEKSTTIVLDFQSVHEVGGFMGLHEKIEEIVNVEKDNNTIIHLAGNPVSVYWLGMYSQRMKYVFLIALFVIGLLHYHAFRTKQGLIIPIVTAILSVVWALGILGATGTPLDTFNIMTPILILAIAAGHSVQILKRYYEEYYHLRDNKKAVIESTTKIGMVMMVAGFVAAAGFFSLITFQNVSMKAFGIFTAMGILSALIIEMTFIPALRTLLSAPTEKHVQRERIRSEYDTIIEKISKMILARKWKGIIITTVLLIGVAIFGITKLKTENCASSYFFDNSEFIKDLNAANNNTPGAYVVQVLVEGNETDILKDPQSLRDIQKVQDYASSLPNVGKAISLVDIMKTMNKAMHSDSVKYEVLPESRDLVAQYLLMYSLSSSPSDFDKVVDQDYKKAIITLYTKHDSYDYAIDLQSKIDNYAKTNLKDSKLSFHVGGGIMYGAALTDIVIKGKVKNILQICGIIFLIVSLVFLSFNSGFIALLPLVISVIFNMGLMGLTGIWLSTSTATISAMAIGIGADYAIYFMFRFREEMAKGLSWDDAFKETMQHSGKAILYVASAVAIGYMCLMLSGFLVHIYLGILVPLTMFVCSFGTLTLVPIIILALKPKFISRRK